jgi:signal transduction histidine kinase
LYAELDERANHLERADQLKTRFLSDLNHEIRTPLNAVRNVARLLLDGYEGALSGRQRKAVEMMRSSTNALNDLVNDWLDLARIEAGKVDLHLSDVPVDDLFAGLRALFRPLATPPGVELVFEDGARVAPLRTDESKIAQILRNFISNALKFTERGEVRVGVSDREGNMVAFMVADTGIGIAPEHLAKIFEEFAQIDNPMQRKVKGTGLGLPLSRRLAQMLGGDVTVVSDAGRGSCFTLVVPRAFVEAEQTPALERSHA